MTTIAVALNQSPYRINVGSGTLTDLGRELKRLKIGKDAIVITSKPIRRLHGEALSHGLAKHGFSVKFIEVPDGERSKSIHWAIRVIGKIVAFDVLKQSFIIAFGGGVVGDLTGYVAAAYKRGIPFVQVPTTFLAQIDSAIGGKVGVDLRVGKNLIGAFYQPKTVWSDIKLLKTLTKRQIRNGLAEAVKYGIIADAKFFAYIEKNFPKILLADDKTLEYVVAKCSRIKTDIVLADEKETRGLRTILNYGHTIGHAIESASGYRKYQHGEAITLGMRIATELSSRFAGLPKKDGARINNLLTDIGLPQRIASVSTTDIMRYMKHDKKFIHGKNRFVLCTKIGRVKVVEGLPEKAIVQAVKNCR